MTVHVVFCLVRVCFAFVSLLVLWAGCVWRLWLFLGGFINIFDTAGKVWSGLCMITAGMGSEEYGRVGR